MESHLLSKGGERAVRVVSGLVGDILIEIILLVFEQKGREFKELVWCQSLDGETSLDTVSLWWWLVMILIRVERSYLVDFGGDGVPRLHLLSEDEGNLKTMRGWNGMTSSPFRGVPFLRREGLRRWVSCRSWPKMDTAYLSDVVEQATKSTHNVV